MIFDVQHTCSSRSALRNQPFLAPSRLLVSYRPLGHYLEIAFSSRMRTQQSSKGCYGDDASLTRGFALTLGISDGGAYLALLLRRN